MSTIKTLYRAIVMIATGIIIVKGWQLYGPSTDQVKSGARRVIDLAHESVEKSQHDAAERPSDGADPRVSAAPLAGESKINSAEVTPKSLQNSLPTVSSLTPEGTNGATIGTGESGGADPPQLLTEAAPPTPTEDGDRMPKLMSRLEELGVAEPKLDAWGSSGKLYRFCCQAAWGDSASYTRQFESVASEPIAAVEQVVAEVEAWRTAEREKTALR